MKEAFILKTYVFFRLHHGIKSRFLFSPALFFPTTINFSIFFQNVKVAKLSAREN